MKVGIFLDNIKPTSGGGFTFLDEIIQALMRLESKHIFVLFNYLNKKQSKEITPKHVEFVSLRLNFLERRLAKGRVGKLLRLHKRFELEQRLGRLVAEHRIELMWFVTALIEVDIPYIFTVWDLQHRLQPWFPEVSANGGWRIRENAFSTAIPRASKVIVGTEAGKAEIIHFYRVPPERVKLIPHPTPQFALTALEDSNETVLTKYHIPEGYLFYPAQFWAHKNHIGLLLAVKLLRQKYGCIFPVVLVGSDSGNLQYVRRIADELDLSAQVHFLGFIPREDLAELYRNAFALTYLTFFGPDNLPPLEAFALGCPVIASNVSGAQEQLGDAALLVDPKNEEQIAQAVMTLHDDPVLRQTLVQRGLKRATKWTGDDYVRGVFSILDEFEPVRRCWDKG